MGMKRVNVQRDVESRQRIAERSFFAAKRVMECETVEVEVGDAESEVVPEPADHQGESVPGKKKKGGRKAKGDAEEVSV